MGADDLVLPDNLVPYGRRIRELAAERGDQAALTFVPSSGEPSVLTWRDLHDRSTRIARALMRRGLGPGDRLAVTIPNSPEHVLAALATWKIGATIVPVRWDLPMWELDRVMAVLQPTMAIGTDDDVFAADLDESSEPLDDVISMNSSAVMSSGSTGTPKVILRLMPGVVDTENTANRLIEEYGPLGPQTVGVPAPMYHSNGFLGLIHLMGGDRVVLFEKFDADLVLGAVGEHAITGMVGTTIMLQRMARSEQFDSADLSSLDWLMHGAAPLPPWLARLWIDRVGPQRFFVCYGSTEGVGAAFARGDDYLAHPGTVGRGANGAEIAVFDEAGSPVAPGEVGLVHMRSPSGVLGRYEGEAAPIPIRADGFATVGDLGWLDEDGFLFLADRRTDMIITGGANVFPAEVEAALSEHPEVADTVVIGLPDDEWGQRVHALVVANHPERPPETDQLRGFVAERLARYKVPKSVELVSSIPRTEAFKVNRSALVAERSR